MMLRRLALAAILALAPSLALAQTNSPDFSVAAYVRYVLNGNVTLGGNVTVGGNLTVGGSIIDNTNGISLNNPTGGLKGAGTINVAGDYYKNGTIIPETVLSPLALSAGGVVSCPTCVLISGTSHGDSNYSILSGDRYVYTNAAFTAPRTWTLPAANALGAGTTIWVQDAQGTVTSTNTLTVQRAGADTVNVSGTNIVMTGGGGGTQFTTDGVSNWGTAVQTVTTGGTGRQTLTNHGVLVGAATSPLTQLAVGANGTLLLGATGADPAFNTMSQDATITAAGVITVTKTGNVAFGTFATAAAATKADQQTGTSNVVPVAPLHQQDHASATKAWASFTAGRSPSINASFNVSGVTSASTGLYVVSFTTAFASTSYQCAANPVTAVASANGMYAVINAKATGSVTFNTVNNAAGAVADPTVALDIECHGAQ